MGRAALSAMPPRARQVRVPPGYLPMTQAEWEGWRFPCRFDWKLLRQREAAGLRANGVALAAALVDGVLKAGGRIETGTRLTKVSTGPDRAGTEPGVARRRSAAGGQSPEAGDRTGGGAAPSPRDEEGAAQHPPPSLLLGEAPPRRYSLPGFSSGAVPAWLPRAESPGALAALIGVDPEGLERT